MFKKALLASCLAASLAGCNSPNSTGSDLALAVLIANVQSAAIAACQFVPTAATIADLFTAAPAAKSAEAVANIICGSISKPKGLAAAQAYGDAVYGVYGNVKIVGHFQ